MTKEILFLVPLLLSYVCEIFPHPFHLPRTHCPEGENDASKKDVADMCEKGKKLEMRIEPTANERLIMVPLISQHKTKLQ
jgi:hypothetical protein